VAAKSPIFRHHFIVFSFEPQYIIASMTAKSDVLGREQDKFGRHIIGFWYFIVIAF
jgi:hypothetical protein